MSTADELIYKAAVQNEQPLLPRQTMFHARRRMRIAKLAREYITDFNLVHATARAGLDWDETKDMERDPDFICTVSELIEAIDGDTVSERKEILVALKREAFTAAKPADRIKALELLAKLQGMELPQEHDVTVRQPILNVTLSRPKDKAIDV